MNDLTWDRRELNRLAIAAVGGLFAGVLSGCGNITPTVTTNKDKEGDKDKGKEQAELPRLLQDPHVCRGINTCKNKGKKGSMNECAGQGHCATVSSHDCNGTNDCKGQGGCGENPGENECKGKGGCAVPLEGKKTWPKARKRFEELMTKANKKFGEAPAM